MRNFFSCAAFQLAWYACASGEATGRPLLGVVVVAGLLVVQSCWLPAPGRQAALVLFVGLIGTIVDSLQSRCGVLRFATPLHAGCICPLSITALWMSFAGTLHQSLAWLKPRPRAATVFGLVGGPLSYLAGERMGALHLGENRPLSLLMIGLAWGILTPTLLYVCRMRPFNVEPREVVKSRQSKAQPVAGTLILCSARS